MDRAFETPIHRRLALGGGFALASMLAWPQAQRRLRVITQRGMAGGGLVRFAEGEAQFSLSASSQTVTEDETEGEPAFMGSVVWVDGSVGLTLVSTQITNYENLNLDEGEGRRIEGFFGLGDGAVQPFLMDAFQFDLPGAEADRIVLRVGAAASEGGATPGTVSDFTYVADGNVVVGDLQTADFVVDLDSGQVSTPEPG